ncbi:MAG TPA: 5'/3'-nucleotidase SurE [Nitrososphaerales archaeon]|nr:5'/3'-nucleotidase SurE [Nitrososphaerales archaeon]
MVPVKSMRRKLVMVTNDDGILSHGLRDLATSITKYADVVIVAPDSPQSASALSLTLHKPLRVEKFGTGRIESYAVSGTPGDCVVVGIKKVLGRKPDLVASGINLGDNDSLQDILGSGTVAAALKASLMDVPAIAFSMEVRGDLVFGIGGEQPDFRKAAVVAGELVREVLETGMPRGVNILNVNFPGDLRAETGIELTRVAPRKYVEKALTRKDPRGKSYYWIFSKRLSRFPEGSDTKTVVVDRKISITPITLRMTKDDLSDLSPLIRNVKKSVGRAFRPS